MEEIFDLLLCRPLAFIIAKPLSLTRVTPDHVSLFALFWAFVVAYFYWQGDYRSVVIGAMAYLFWNILDCVDGQLARMTKKSSPVGYVLDQAVDWFSAVLTFVGLTHAVVARHPGEPWWWAVGIAAMVAMGWECGVLEQRRHEWMERVYGSRKTIAEDLKKLDGLAAEWRAEGSHPLWRLVVRYYHFQRWLQRWSGQSAGVDETPTHTDEENRRYAKYHKKALRLAVWLGPTTHMMVTIVCSLLDRVELYFYLVFAVGLPLAFLVQILSAVARRQERLATSEAS
jgi:phosphatidylglycerophosphate synthase